MPNIKEFSEKIKSVSATQQITKAMKMVSASKLSKIQSKALFLKPYRKKLAKIVDTLHLQISHSHSHPLFEVREKISSVAFVVFSSDKGLCGSFNNSIIKTSYSGIMEFIERNPHSKVKVFPIGEKALSFFKKTSLDLDNKYVSFGNNVSYDNSKNIAKDFRDFFLKKDFDQIFLVYNHFKNISSSAPVIEKFLPIDISELKKHFFIDRNEIENSSTCIFDSQKEESIDIVLPAFLNISMYSAMLESSCSEHSTRMLTMHKATDNAEEMLRKLKISYNRSRQASITQEISEIVSGSMNSI